MTDGFLQASLRSYPAVSQFSANPTRLGDRTHPVSPGCDSKSLPGAIFTALDVLVDYSVRLTASMFEVRSFTRSWLTTGFMIAYVYLTGVVIVFLAKVVTAALVEFTARNNAFGLTNSIARERGIAAYQAWLPLERIRPPNIPQDIWEERFAWPANTKSH